MPRARARTYANTHAQTDRQTDRTRPEKKKGGGGGMCRTPQAEVHQHAQAKAQAHTRGQDLKLRIFSFLEGCKQSCTGYSSTSMYSSECPPSLPARVAGFLMVSRCEKTNNAQSYRIVRQKDTPSPSKCTASHDCALPQASSAAGGPCTELPRAGPRRTSRRRPKPPPQTGTHRESHRHHRPASHRRQQRALLPPLCPSFSRYVFVCVGGSSNPWGSEGKGGGGAG